MHTRQSKVVEQYTQGEKNLTPKAKPWLICFRIRSGEKPQDLALE